MASFKYALVVDGVIDVISYDPDRDEDGNILPEWVPVADDVFAGFIDNEDGSFSAPEPPEPPEPVDTLPPPAVLVMSASNVKIEGFDVNVTGGGYNFGGAMRDGPGLYALFTLAPLDGTAFDPWFSVGGGFTLKATILDPYFVSVEARDINGELADPEFFSMRIYQP